MDQNTAQVLFEEGAVLVFLDMPEGSEFGIDFNSWNVGPNFRGMKMIPPGLHFVYYSAVGRDQQVGPRSGFFHNFSKREIMVKKWDKYLEDIKPEEATPEELSRFEDNKKDMDKFLAPYPYESYKKWVSLTKHITGDMARELQPECGTVCSMAQFVSEPSTSQSRRQKAQQAEATETEHRTAEPSTNRSQPGSLEDGLPKMQAVEGTRIRYTPIPRQKFPQGASPAEVTKFSMDSSFQLDRILQARYSSDPTGILGEVQLAFVCFLVGQDYDSFEQWKRLVSILCTSDSAMLALPDLFVDFIGVLHFQVREIPQDFFVDIVSQDNFLTHTLHEFFANLDSEDVDPKLRARGVKFRDHLTHKFQWDFTSEPDDDAPVVVEGVE